MILFFCGAPKHGSHFQMFIVEEALEQRGIKYEQVGNEIFHNHDLIKAKELLADLDPRSDDIFVCKGHWGTATERDILLSYENIRVFHIWRDLRDVLVSQYYYLIRKFGKSYKDFSDYYWQAGRSMLFMQVAYRRAWMPVAEDSRVYNSGFTELKQDFHRTAGQLLAFAGIENVNLDDLEKRLALEQLKVKHNDPEGKFFRRGAVGEHREVINSTKIYRDMAYIENLGDVRLRLHSSIHKLSRKAKGFYLFRKRQLETFLARPVGGIYRKIRSKEKTR